MNYAQMYAQEALLQYNRIMDMLADGSFSDDDMSNNVAAFHYKVESLFKYDLENEGTLYTLVQNELSTGIIYPVYFHTNYESYNFDGSLLLGESKEYLANIQYTVFHTKRLFFRWVGIEKIIDVIILLYLPNESIDSENRDIIHTGKIAGKNLNDKYITDKHSYFAKTYFGRLMVCVDI
jgi:replication fork clamp-binding protein CrfC